MIIRIYYFHPNLICIFIIINNTKTIGQWRSFDNQTIDTDHLYPNVIQLHTGYATVATLGHIGFIIAAVANTTGTHFKISKVTNASTTNPSVLIINIGY